MNHTRFRHLCCIVSATLLAAAANAGAEVLLDDDFADGERNDQNLPSSSAWFYRMSGDVPSLSAASEALVYTSGGTTSFVTLYTYFTPAMATDLSAGQTMTVSLDFSMGNVVDSTNGIRFGLFNSGGSANRISADGNGSTMSSLVTGYRGYSVWFNPSATSSAYEIHDRTGSSQTLYAAADNPALGASNTASIGMVANTTTSLDLSITRTSGTALSIFSSVNGIELTRADTDVLTFGFDTFTIFYAANTLGGGNPMAIDNIMVTVIPEPSVYGVLCAAVCGMALLLRRRRAGGISKAH